MKSEMPISTLAAVGYDPDQLLSLDCRRRWRMAPVRLAPIEVAAIASIILSLALLAFIGFSIWAEP